MEDKNTQQIQMHISEDVMKGRYANFMQVNMSKEEFTLDFGMINKTHGVITDRLYVNPAHVKRMIDVLQRMMDQYEKMHGLVDAADMPKEIGFHTS